MLVAVCLLLDQLSNHLRLGRGGEEEEEELEGESRKGLMKGWRRREEGGRDGGREGGREGKKSDFRVLIASATNVAVDNILVQLLEKGYVSLLPLPPPIPTSLPPSFFPSLPLCTRSVGNTFFLSFLALSQP
jgi:hypothetical protein